MPERRTQHISKPSERKAPVPPLTRLVDAARQGKLAAFKRALDECVENKTPAGQWQHHILEVVITSGKHNHGPDALAMLLACPKPPKPNESENFLGLAFSQDSYAWAIRPLLDAGFTLKSSAFDGINILRGLGEDLSRGRWRNHELARPGLLTRTDFLNHFESGLADNTFSSHCYQINEKGTVKHRNALLEIDGATRLLTMVNDQIQDQNTFRDLAHRWSHAVGRGLRRATKTNIQAFIEHPEWWQEGYALLRGSGLLQADSIRQGLGNTNEPGAGLFERMEALILERKMEQRTRLAPGTKGAGLRL